MTKTARHNPENARILVVDDQAMNRMLISSILNSGGFRHVEAVEDAAAALLAIDACPPDCVLLDIVMPGMDGLTLCRELRAMPDMADRPIIIQTALTDPSDRRAAFASGATDVVAKPFDRAELLARVRVHVANGLLTASLQDYKTIVDAELDEARRLAETLHPTAGTLDGLAASHGIRFDGFFRTSSELGGDYWTVWPTAPGKVGLLIADVTGHGVAAALKTFELHAMINPVPPFADDPLRLVRHLDKRLHGRGDSKFIAGCYVIIDTDACRLDIVGAGMRDAILIGGAGTITRLSASGLPLGLRHDGLRKVRSGNYASGDVLVLYSDALVETGDAGAPVNEDELACWIYDVLERFKGPADQLARCLGATFLDAFGPQLDDDLLVVTATLP